MEGFQVFNGLECKIACNSSKVSCTEIHLVSFAFFVFIIDFMFI